MTAPVGTKVTTDVATSRPCDRARRTSPGGLDLTARLLELSGLVAGASVLDVGCGRGAGAGFLAARGLLVVGVDADRETVQAARRSYPHLDLRVGRAEDLDPTGDPYDAVFMECVLSLTDPVPALRAVRRVLAPGGLLALSDLYVRREAVPAGRRPRDLRLPASEGDVRALLARSGFAVTAWEDHSSRLAQFAGEVLMAGCSIEGLVDEAVRARVPMRDLGYYLAVAGSAVETAGTRGGNGDG